MKKLTVLLITGLLAAALTACGTNDVSSAVLKETSEASVQISEQSVQEATEKSSQTIDKQGTSEISAQAEEQGTQKASENPAQPAEQGDQEAPEAPAQTQEQTTGDSDKTVSGSSAINEDLFTDRDLEQTADLSEAETVSLEDGRDISITEEGIYVLAGTASDVTVVIDASDDAKVQLVLNGVDITNSDSPFIYAKNADKVFVTTASATNSITVTGTFTADGETNTDAAIFAKDDLVLNGTGSLTISSTDNGISCKDDLKITGGTLVIDCVNDALEANDSVAIAGGNITINTNKDGIHAENDEDNTTGYVYIGGGSLNITAGDDGIHGTTIVQVDDGEITVNAAEGIEATWVQINGGTIDLSAGDDGINAARKSDSYTPTIEINGGYTTIVMGSGDTDALDSNGNLYINGGTIDITAQFPFDYDGTAQYNGGTMIVNGEETTEITNQFGGMGPGGNGGGFGPGGGNFNPGGGEGFNPGDWNDGNFNPGNGGNFNPGNGGNGGNNSPGGEGNFDPGSSTGNGNFT